MRYWFWVEDLCSDMRQVWAKRNLGRVFCFFSMLTKDHRIVLAQAMFNQLSKTHCKPIGTSCPHCPLVYVAHDWGGNFVLPSSLSESYQSHCEASHSHVSEQG